MKETTKKIIKISIKVINVLVILGAIGVLAYYFGYKKLETNLMQKGFNIAVSQIVKTIQTNGEVKINSDITLIMKANLVNQLEEK